MSVIPNASDCCKPIGSLAKGLVLNAIATTPDPRTKKERILICREAGLFTDAEAQDWIRIYGLEDA